MTSRRSTTRVAACGVLVLLAGALQVQWAGGEAVSNDGTTHVFDIVVQRGKRVSGPAVLKVRQGDEVTIHVTTDGADEFHLHGYNLLMKLQPNTTATLQFVAKLSGRFTYELHKADLELGALEVYPR
jgi:plastocyanin